MHTLTVSVAEILGQPGAYRDFDVDASLSGVGGPLARVTEDPVGARLRAESVIEGVLITGQVQARTALQCARCLKDFDSGLLVEVCDLFVTPDHEVSTADDVYRISGAEIGLEPMLRDALTLGLPFRPLCRGDCKGLCARCGTDLNEGSCDCTDDETDPRWAALDALRDGLEGGQHAAGQRTG